MHFWFNLLSYPTQNVLNLSFWFWNTCEQQRPIIYLTVQSWQHHMMWMRTFREQMYILHCGGIWCRFESIFLIDHCLSNNLQLRVVEESFGMYSWSALKKWFRFLFAVSYEFNTCILLTTSSLGTKNKDNEKYFHDILNYGKIQTWND